MKYTIKYEDGTVRKGVPMEKALLEKISNPALETTEEIPARKQNAMFAYMRTLTEGQKFRLRQGAVKVGKDEDGNYCLHLVQEKKIANRYSPEVLRRMQEDEDIKAMKRAIKLTFSFDTFCGVEPSNKCTNQAMFDNLLKKLLK